MDATSGTAIASTPHTSPESRFESRFPTTEEKWKRNVESTIFGTQPPLSQNLEELLKLPSKEFMVDECDDNLTKGGL